MLAPKSKQQFQQLVKKYQAGKATPEERAFIEKYYDYFQQEETAVDKLTMEERTGLESRLLQKIQEEITQAQPKVVPLYRRTAFRMAAAAVLLFVVCSLWFVVDRRSANMPGTGPVAVVHDLVPGSNKAVLTLADGTKITLDSAANGAIAQQGSIKVVKMDEGKLAYSGEPGAGSQESMQYNTMTTPRGGQYQLTLPDGTKVWLNAASSITYPVAFNEKQRKVKIAGEAYFEVSRNKEKPFIVDVDGKQLVEVLGTHFNINSYANEEAIKTTLLEGKVKVSAISGSRLSTRDYRLLSPGEQAILGSVEGTTNYKLQTTNNINIDNVMAWKNGLFEFDETDIQSVMRQMERWYDVEVVFEGAVTQHFNGSISRQVNASKVLNMLEKTGGVRFSIEGKKVIVKKH
jgi:transmembrane sensor